MAMVWEADIVEDFRLFETELFDCDAFINSKCKSMSEKGVRKLYGDVLKLRHAFVDHARRSVHADYASFMRITNDIANLESCVLLLRSLFSCQVGAVHVLEEGVSTVSASLSNRSSIFSCQRNEVISPHNSIFLPHLDYCAFLEKLDVLEVLLAERNIDKALVVLEEARSWLAKHSKKVSPSNLTSFHASLTSMKDRLIDYLVEATKKPSVCGNELRQSMSALKKLGECHHAHSLLLKCHSARLNHHVKGLRRRGTSYGGAYTAALSQIFFSAIAQAAKDCDIVFGENKGYGSELLLWAFHVLEEFVAFLEKHVLSSAAAAGGLRAAAECVQIAFGHCSLLEKQGLSLSPYLAKLFKPSVEQALNANLNRIEESITAHVAADDWSLSNPVSSLRAFGSARYSQGHCATLKLSSSAHMFNHMIQDSIEAVAPLISNQLSGPMIGALDRLFGLYVDLLMTAIPKYDSTTDHNISMKLKSRNVQIATSLEQQIVILGNALNLAEQVLPCVVTRFVQLQQNITTDTLRQNKGPLIKQKEIKLHLQQASEKLQDFICSQYAEDVIKDRTGRERLEPETYTNLYVEGNDKQEWKESALPSHFFQELYRKSKSIVKTAREMLRRENGIVKHILRRLIERILIWLLDNETFWEGMVGTAGLTETGFEQFVLDMQFLDHMAHEECFSSKWISEAISDLIALASHAFSLNGGDPARMEFSGPLFSAILWFTYMYHDNRTCLYCSR